MKEILVGQRNVAGKEFAYYILADELCGAGGQAGEEYGVRIRSARDSMSVRGITTSADRIRNLAALLMVQTVTPVSLREIVEDWL